MINGFVTVAVVAGLGSLLARYGVLDRPLADGLSRLALLVATPALMVVMIGSSDVTALFSAALVATVGGVLLGFLFHAAVARLLLPRAEAEPVVAGLAAVFVNAGTLGIPITAYVLGDASVVLPMIFVQLLVLQPAALVALNRSSDRSPSAGAWVALRLSLVHPLIAATVVGVLVAVTGTRLPSGVDEALRLVGAMAVPAMLLSYGASLVSGSSSVRRTRVGEVALVSVTKLVVHPAATYLVGRFVLGLEGDVLTGITVVAALPSGQNVHLLAAQFRQGEALARDSILVTTLLALPVLVLVGAAVGAGG